MSEPEQIQMCGQMLERYGEVEDEEGGAQKRTRKQEA